jgi:tRNA(adenine34) deaminase
MSEFSELDLGFMQRALKLANQAQEQNEVPVGAVLVEGGRVLAEGSNSPITSNDPTAHAEIQALRAGCLAKANYRLPETTLYVTLEPCAMCAGAILHSRVARVVIATAEPRAGAAGSVFNILQNPLLNHQCLVEYGLLANDSAHLLKSFFKAKR